LQDQLKERLTGAAILVVVVVLAVPEMFRGRPGAVAPTSRPEASAVPLHTWTLVDGRPLDGGAAPAPADPAGPAAASSPVGAGVVPPAAAAAPEPPAAVDPAAAPAASMPPQVLTQSTVTPQAVSPRPPVAGPVAKPPVARLDRGGSGQAGWVVQVGSFHARELAERMAREVHAKGFTVHVVGPDARGLYRVRSGLQADRGAALALRQQMLARGLKPIVNASP